MPFKLAAGRVDRRWTALSFSISDIAARAWLASVAVVLLAPGLVAFALAPSTAGAQGLGKTVDGKPRLLRVVKPQDDMLMRGRTLQVRVRVAKGAELRSATLDRRNVKRLFHDAGSGLLVATLDKRRLGKALPKGHNFLHVVVRRGGKRGRVESETISFTRVVPSKSLVARFRAGFQARKSLRATVVLTRPTAMLKVTLNGRDVTRQFRRSTPLRRSARLGASDGLRHRVNRLRVLVWDYHGEYRLLRRTIRVGRQTTVAGAGADRRLRAGGAIRLDGRKTKRALLRSGRVNRGKLHFRWTLRHKPRGSKARLTRRSRSRPVLRTDLPGSYRLELRAFQRGPGGGAVRTTSVDTAEVNAQPQPMVPVDTFATAGGLEGIKVEVSRECRGAKAAAKPPCFYPNPGKPEDVHVVVLDRETLEPVAEKANRAYTNDNMGEFAAAMAGFATKLEPKQGQTCLYSYDTDKLVLIAQRKGEIPDEADFNVGISYLNTDPKDCSPGREGFQPAAGPYSVIAVPGTLAGKKTANLGNELVGPDGETHPAGSLVGFLKPAADDPTEAATMHSFEFGEELSFDTGAEGGKAVRIGDKTLPIPSSPSGLAMYSFDPADPSGGEFRSQGVFTNVGGNPDAGLEWTRLAELLGYFRGGSGVVLVANGKLGGFASEPEASSFADVLRELERLGANPDTFARAVASEGTYSMLATVNEDSETIAYDSSSVKAGADPSSPVAKGRLTGTLLRGSDTFFFPTEPDPSGLGARPQMRSVIYSDDVEWELTPAPESGVASCQETAFAYLVEQAGEAFPAGTAPKLWEDARARGCQGIPHPAATGGGRADSLEGDGCATEEATAIGAIGRNVREASMAMRNKYTSLDYHPSETNVLKVPLPAGAPFTAADLACAKAQMIDELSARSGARELFTVLLSPEEDQGGAVVLELDRVAEEIKSGALSSIASQLHATESSTAGFWVGFALQSLDSLVEITALFDPEERIVEKAMQIGWMVSSTGSTIQTYLEGPAANPAAAVDEYVLLASQIEREQIDLEAQIGAVLSAQGNGAGRALEAIDSDPHRLATVAEKRNGEWEIGRAGLELAQDAYVYRVRQLAYQDFLSQLYEGVRFNYTHAFQIVDTWPDEWNDNAWIPETGTARALASAKEPTCGEPPTTERNASLKPPLPGANPGTPFGFGKGNEYQPQVVVAPKGQTPPRFLDYVMVEPGTIGGFPTVADYDTVQPAFEQPTRTNGNYGAGLYAPDFWFRNMGLAKTMHCNQEKKTMAVGPTQRLAFGSGDLWPTPTNTAHK